MTAHELRALTDDQLSAQITQAETQLRALEAERRRRLAAPSGVQVKLTGACECGHCGTWLEAGERAYDTDVGTFCTKKHFELYQAGLKS